MDQIIKDVYAFEEKLMSPSTPVQKEPREMLMASDELKKESFLCCFYFIAIVLWRIFSRCYA